MKTNGYKIMVVILGIFILSSCQYIPTVTQKDLNASYMKKTEAEAKIVQLEKDHQKQLIDNAEKLSNNKNDVIDGQDLQLQAGANALYTVQQITVVPPQPGTNEFIRARAIEGFTAMGKPPTVQEIVEGSERLKQYMSTYQKNDPAEIENLRKAHDELVKKNGILVTTTEVAKKELEITTHEKLVIEQKYITDGAAAQTKLNEANNSVIDKEHQRAEQEKIAREKAESFERLKKQLMIWCGIGAIIALAAAIYSPIGKGGLGMISGVLGAVAITLPFIQPWMIWVVLGVVVLAIVIVVGNFLYKHNQAEVSNNNMIHAIEDTKETPNATVADLKANLSAWNTKYSKDANGNTVEVTDKNAENYVKEKLMKIGRLKTTKPTNPFVVPPSK